MNGVRPMAPMSLRSMKTSAPGDVGGDLDPAEVVLLGQRDVDVDQLVGARADRALLGLPPLRLEDQADRLRLERALPGRLAERARPLVVEVDRRPLRLRVDDHQPLGVDVGQHGQRRRSRRRAAPAARPARRAPRGGRRAGLGAAHRGGAARLARAAFPAARQVRAAFRAPRQASAAAAAGGGGGGASSLPITSRRSFTCAASLAFGVLVEVALEVLLGLLELLRLLVGDGDVEQERRDTASARRPSRNFSAAAVVLAPHEGGLRRLEGLLGVVQRLVGRRLFCASAARASRQSPSDAPTHTAVAITRAADRATRFSSSDND